VINNGFPAGEMNGRARLPVFHQKGYKVNDMKGIDNTRYKNGPRIIPYPEWRAGI